MYGNHTIWIVDTGKIISSYNDEEVKMILPEVERKRKADRKPAPTLKRQTHYDVDLTFSSNRYF